MCLRRYALSTVPAGIWLRRKVSIQDTTEYRALRRALRGGGYFKVISRGEYVEVTEPPAKTVLNLPAGQAESVFVALAGDVKSMSDKTLLAASLGDIPGPPELPLLLQFVSMSGKGTGDLRCASLVALAKRILSSGREAGDLTSTFADAFLGKDTFVHEYAARCLAAVGDDRAWMAIHARLRRRLAGAGTGATTQSLLVYLARNSVGHPDRMEELRALVNRFWGKLDHQWLVTYLPNLDPAHKEQGNLEPDFCESAAWGRKMLLLPES